MFNILKSCQKWIFGPVKDEKFSRCLVNIFTHNAIMDIHNCYQLWMVFLFFGRPPTKKKKKRAGVYAVAPYYHIIIKWPTPLGARSWPIKNVNKIL